MSFQRAVVVSDCPSLRLADLPGSFVSGKAFPAPRVMVQDILSLVFLDDNRDNDPTGANRSISVSALAGASPVDSIRYGET